MTELFENVAFVGFLAFVVGMCAGFALGVVAMIKIADAARPRF